jgi:hypothetical protein
MHSAPVFQKIKTVIVVDVRSVERKNTLKYFVDEFAQSGAGRVDEQCKHSFATYVAAAGTLH